MPQTPVAGSADWDDDEAVIKDMFGMDYVLPVHQGRAAENILGRTYVTPGTVVPMNYHFTTSKAVSYTHLDVYKRQAGVP